MRIDWKLLTLFLLTGGLYSMALFAQMPPKVAQITWYATAVFYDGTSFGPNGSPEVSWTGSATLDCPGYSNRFAVYVGRHSHSYYAVVDSGTNGFVVWPPTPPPTVVNFAYGGQLVLRATNPPASLFFRSYPATNSTWVSISDSSNNLDWNSSFAFLNTTGRAWSITRQ